MEYACVPESLHGGKSLNKGCPYDWGGENFCCIKPLRFGGLFVTSVN